MHGQTEKLSQPPLFARSAITEIDSDQTPLHGGQRLLMLGIYSGKEQHRFSAASNGKGSAPCARRIGLILDLLSLLDFCVKLSSNARLGSCGGPSYVICMEDMEFLVFTALLAFSEPVR